MTFCSSMSLSISSVFFPPFPSVDYVRFFEGETGSCVGCNEFADIEGGYGGRVAGGGMDRVLWKSRWLDRIQWNGGLPDRAQRKVLRGFWPHLSQSCFRVLGSSSELWKARPFQCMAPKWKNELPTGGAPSKTLLHTGSPFCHGVWYILCICLPHACVN